LVEQQGDEKGLASAKNMQYQAEMVVSACRIKPSVILMRTKSIYKPAGAPSWLFVTTCTGGMGDAMAITSYTDRVSIMKLVDLHQCVEVPRRPCPATPSIHRARVLLLAKPITKQRHARVRVGRWYTRPAWQWKTPR
jgi:hypothetical protein